MDRCRCEDYAEAVRNLRFFTVGTVRPDLIENHDRTGVRVKWIKHGVDYDDMKFTRPKAIFLADIKKESAPPEQIRIERMWCPYMTPVKIE